MAHVLAKESRTYAALLIHEPHVGAPSMHLLVGQQRKRLFEFRIEGVRIERQDVSHVDHSLELSVASKQRRVIEQGEPNPFHIVPDRVVKSLGLVVGHLKVEIRKDNDKIVLILVRLQKFLS